MGAWRPESFTARAVSNRREIFSVPQVCGASHCSLLYVTLSPFAHHAVAITIPRTGDHPLRKAPAAVLAALHTAFSRCLSGVAVGVGSHLGRRRCRWVCWLAGGNQRRADLSLVGHGQLRTFGAGVQHLFPTSLPYSCGIRIPPTRSGCFRSRPVRPRSRLPFP